MMSPRHDQAKKKTKKMVTKITRIIRATKINTVLPHNNNNNNQPLHQEDDNMVILIILRLLPPVPLIQSMLSKLITGKNRSPSPTSVMSLHLDFPPLSKLPAASPL